MKKPQRVDCINCQNFKFSFFRIDEKNKCTLGKRVMFRLPKFPDGECGWIRYCDSFIEQPSFKPLINSKMDGFEEKLIQSKEVKKLIDFLVRESKINHANPKELGLPEFRIVVRDDGTAYGHVMNRSSETVDFKLQL